MQLNETQLWRKLQVQLKTSPKQAKLVVVLLILLALTLVHMLSGGEPETALATPSISPPTSATTLTPDTPEVTTMAVRAPLPDLPDNAVRNLFESDWFTNKRTIRPTVLAPQTTKQAHIKQTPDLILELTLVGAKKADQHCAVISGQRVRVGDVMGGLVVESISPNVAVLVGSNGERVVLRMN